VTVAAMAIADMKVLLLRSKRVAPPPVLEAADHTLHDVALLVDLPVVFDLDLAVELFPVSIR